MKIKIKREYTILENKFDTVSIDFDFEIYVKHYNVIFYNEDQLLSEVLDYFSWEGAEYVEVRDRLFDEESLELTLLNEKQIIETYKHLITIENCCNFKTGNYCSECGKKLK